MNLERSLQPEKASARLSSCGVWARFTPSESPFHLSGTFVENRHMSFPDKRNRYAPAAPITIVPGTEHSRGLEQKGTQVGRGELNLCEKGGERAKTNN